jgi:hypothetical protein
MFEFNLTIIFRNNPSALNTFICRNYNGPQRASPEHKGSSQRNYSRGPYSPGFEFEDDSHSKYMSDHSRSKIIYERDMEDSEVKLISFCSMYLVLTIGYP